MEIVPAFLVVFMVSMYPRAGVGPHHPIIAGSYQCESETQEQTVYCKNMPAALWELKFKSHKIEYVEMWFP